MKLKFKKQAYQTNAVEAVADCFAGQPKREGLNYRIDPGRAVDASGQATAALESSGFKNADLALTPGQVLENIHAVQRRQNLPQSAALVKTKVCDINLDVEMETGTGKTYCYVKTMFELNARYGWSKFIVVVPSIAIREGVFKSLEITAEHFQDDYKKRARFFIYNSKQLHNLESFASDAGINVMVINVQAFNATGKDARRIYEELDDFQSRRPIDVISANRPILFLDEPQKMEGGKTLDSLANFKPLAVLRYSATHKTAHNKIHRLDALDAYNQKLVKKIRVRGISVKGLTGTNAYLFLESIEVSTAAPVARVMNEQKATVIVEHIAYDPTGETHTMEIFTQDKPKEDFSKAVKANHHIYDYVFTDSKNERDFVRELDASTEVVVYAKLPRGFFIPTPVGNYNPDWAIAFQEGKVKHVYFVAETKGSMSSMDLRKIEESKIECARKFFAKITSDQVKYEVVDGYGKLMELVA